MNNNDVTNFDSFGVEHIPKEIQAYLLTIKALKQTFLEYKHTIQLCVDTFVLYFCVLKGKTFTEYTNLFSPNDFKRMTI